MNLRTFYKLIDIAKKEKLSSIKELLSEACETYEKYNLNMKIARIRINEIHSTPTTPPPPNIPKRIPNFYKSNTPEEIIQAEQNMRKQKDYSHTVTNKYGTPNFDPNKDTWEV